MRTLIASIDLFQNPFPMFGPIAGIAVAVLGGFLALLAIIGTLCFPWWIRRIMVDVRELRKILTDISEIRGIMREEIDARAVRLRLEDEVQQALLKELKQINAHLSAADIVREPAAEQTS